MFWNAWWDPQSFNKHENDNVVPIPLAIHFHYPDNRKANMEFLKKLAPIGARDTYTLDFFKKNDVPSFFSGCMTLFMQNPSMGLPRNNNIYKCDVFLQDTTFENLLPKNIAQSLIKVTHAIDAKMDKYKKFIEGYNRILMYSQAKLVITARIHVALPCVAIGTPVIFLDHKAIWANIRLAGLTDLFQTVQITHNNTEEVKTFFREYPWDNPRPNPNPEKVAMLRSTVLEYIEQFPEIVDTAYKYGIIT